MELPQWKPTGKKLTAPISWPHAMYFGQAIAASGNWLFIGAVYVKSDSSATGVVFVYHRLKTGWREVQALSAKDGDLGYQIVTTGDMVFIKGSLETEGSRETRDAIFVYAKDRGQWQETSVIFPDSGGDMVFNGHELFVGGGDTKDIDIFEQKAGLWKLIGKIDSGEVPLSIGSITSSSQNLLAALTYGAGGFVNGHGELSLYEKQHDKWVKTDAITPAGRFKGYYFISCALSPEGDTLFITAERHVSLGKSINKMTEKEAIAELGSLQVKRHVQVLVYRRRHSGEWQLAATLSPKNPALATSFGQGMAFLNGELFVNAPRANIIANGYWNGAVYVFREQDNDWRQIAKLTTNHPEVAESFGTSFTRTGNTLFVGAPSAHVKGVEQGAVYIFKNQ